MKTVISLCLAPIAAALALSTAHDAFAKDIECRVVDVFRPGRGGPWDSGPKYFLQCPGTFPRYAQEVNLGEDLDTQGVMIIQASKARGYVLKKEGAPDPIRVVFSGREGEREELEKLVLDPEVLGLSLVLDDQRWYLNELNRPVRIDRPAAESETLGKACVAQRNRGVEYVQVSLAAPGGGYYSSFPVFSALGSDDQNRLLSQHRKLTEELAITMYQLASKHRAEARQLGPELLDCYRWGVEEGIAWLDSKAEKGLSRFKSNNRELRAVPPSLEATRQE